MNETEEQLLHDALKRQYSGKKLIIAVDFDGTCCEHRYPEMGPPLPECFDTLKELQAKGHTLIMWSCREGEGLMEAMQYCKDNGITFRSINHNTKDDAWAGSRKIYADFYIDDRMVMGFPGWPAIRQWFKKVGVL